MIRAQCRAHCQCAFCAQPHKDNADHTCLRIPKDKIDGSGMSRDELYMKSLRESTRARALLDSTKNASKFIPDEQLVSSRKRREAKEAAIASHLVPVRRRDRLEELLLLEHKARLREEARLRAERRAAGLPEDDDEVPENSSIGEGVSPETPGSEGSADKQRLGSGHSTPSSRCSADHDLRAALRTIKDIVEEDPGTPQQPLSHDQIYKLRKLVHDQEKKNRAVVAECPDQPHICNHCFAVNVQAKHLCPQMHNSVAFSRTGKVINPDAGVKFGVSESQRGLDGTYEQSNLHLNEISSNRTRLAEYNPHPHGTGVVFLPVVRGAGVSFTGSKGTTNGKSVRFQPTFNNNIAADEAVEDGLQYPGSTYNVYDDRYNSNPIAKSVGFANDSAKSNTSSNGMTETDGGSNAGSGKQPAEAATGASTVHPTSSSALWRTTNQIRESDMERFLTFQKRMATNGRKVYDSTATRDAPQTAFAH